MSIAASRWTRDLAVEVLFLLEQLAGEQVVERVAALAGDDAAADRAADEKQIADQIEHLVADAFVGEAELRCRSGRSGEMTSRSLGVRCFPSPRARSSRASSSKTKVRAGASWDEIVVAEVES